MRLALEKGSLQLYRYAGNNPVKYVDPEGREQNNYIEKIINLESFQPAYLTAEGVGIAGSFWIYGYAQISKNRNDDWILIVAITAQSAAQELGVVEFIGSVELIVDGKVVSTKNLKEPTEPYIMSADHLMVGETAFILPEEGNISIKLNVSYIFSVPEGNVSPIPPLSKIVEVYKKEIKQNNNE